MMQGLRGLEEAHFNYINSVSAYNKAEIRLLLVLGPGRARRRRAASDGGRRSLILAGGAMSLVPKQSLGTRGGKPPPLRKNAVCGSPPTHPE